MSLIIALGSNIGDKLENFQVALDKLIESFGEPIAISSIYTSEPLGEVEQPDFFNAVIEFKSPNLSPTEILRNCLSIEEAMGRKRTIHWGPRIIDIDILFIDELKVSEKHLTIPHPEISNRSFVVRPLMELPFYVSHKNNFSFPDTFDLEAYKSDKFFLDRKK
jgi:2-amino-4-hydroxy-6-hydroxymethyldihydropteridine diphosphokinase